MYDPTLEILVLPTPTEDPAEAQYTAWRDQSYGFLMTQLLTSNSGVEVSAARQLLLDKPFQVKYSRVLDIAYVYVETEDGQLWTRLYKHDLQSEHLTMLAAGELCLAQRFASLIDLLAFARTAKLAKAS